jgi:hypothetical protein
VALESTITKSIQVSAKARGWWVLKVAGGAFQRPGIPDLLCVKHGRAVFLEVKQPGKKPTPLQVHVMQELKNVGGAVAETVTSRAQAEEILDRWDRPGDSEQ